MQAFNYEFSLKDAAEGLRAAKQAAEAGKKIYEMPLFSYVNLDGLAQQANPATRQLPAGPLVFYQSAVGQPGQGFPRALRWSETSLDGPNSMLPQGWAYVARAMGVHFPPQLPIHLKDFFTRHAALCYEKHSTTWHCGAVQFWPCAEFGHQSRSVGVTIPNNLIQYGTNGAVGMRQFPKGAAIYYRPLTTIKWQIDTYEQVFVTTDGLTWNGGIQGVDPGGNGFPTLDGALLGHVMWGLRFEELTS